MMLHHGHDHLIPCRHTFIRKAGSDQINGFRSSPGKNNLIRETGIQEMLYRFASLLMRLCRRLAQEMYASVDISVYVIISILYLFYHLTRFLGSSAIIKIYQRFIVYLMIQDRKVFSDRLNV